MKWLRRLFRRERKVLKREVKILSQQGNKVHALVLAYDGPNRGRFGEVTFITTSPRSAYFNDSR